MQSLYAFFRQNDIDPTVVTVKVNMYRVGSAPNEKTVYCINGAGWTTLCGEYWYSRKTSSFVYRPVADLDPRWPAPPAEFLIDNRPRLSELQRYQQP